MTRAAFVFVLLFFLEIGHADVFCFNEAGADFGIPPALIATISKAESNHDQNVLHWNKDGSYDACHMQINSRWWTWLVKRKGKSEADRMWASLADPCYCTRFGAWILADCFSRHGKNWKGIGCYNATTPSKQAAYAWRIHGFLIKRGN